MKVKCVYCDKEIDDTVSVCPYCNAPNEHLKRMTSDTPRTVEELKEWYVKHNLPDEKVTRFFIGKNVTEAKAIGVCYDESVEDFIVYTNDTEGKRTIRYSGNDEEYAVNLVFLRLKEAILNQKARHLRK